MRPLYLLEIEIDGCFSPACKLKGDTCWLTNQATAKQSDVSILGSADITDPLGTYIENLKKENAEYLLYFFNLFQGLYGKDDSKVAMERRFKR